MPNIHNLLKQNDGSCKRYKKRLQRDFKVVQEEQDILKKAMVNFANEER